MIMGSSGSGKTTLGKIVAEKLGFTFVDIDGAQSLEDNANTIIYAYKEA